MRNALTALALGLLLTPALADGPPRGYGVVPSGQAYGVVPPPVTRGYDYSESYREYGPPRETIVVPENTGPIFVVPPYGLEGPPISLRRHERLLRQGRHPFTGYRVSPGYGYD